VATLVVNPDGSVASREVLEAPDKDIAAAVGSALSAWRFTPSSGKSATSGPCSITGRLMFYFTSQKGKAVVLDPLRDAGSPAGASSAADHHQY
jgi:hypothetical protein